MTVVSACRLRAGFLICLALLTGGVRAASFTPGNIVVYRIGSGGVRFSTLGATSSIDLTGTTVNDTRAIAIYAGQVFTWNSTAGAKGIGPVGAGTPTAGPLAVTRLPGMTDTNSPNTYQFFFAHL